MKQEAWDKQNETGDVRQEMCYRQETENRKYMLHGRGEKGDRRGETGTRDVGQRGNMVQTGDMRKTGDRRREILEGRDEKGDIEDTLM